MAAKLIIFFKKNWVPTALFLAGIAIGWQINIFSSGSSPSSVIRRIRYLPSGSKLIKPLLGFDFYKQDLKAYAGIENEIRSFISDQISNKKASSISVYYRDLDSGQWFGINERDSYNPGSLLKVATMIAYYKKAEEDPSILTQKILYKNLNLTGAPHDPYNVSPNLKIGNYYTAEELIKGMIEDSDNISKDLLINAIDPAYLGKVFTDLGIPSPADAALGDYTISPQRYSLFFRILYNATYLNETLSESALNLLSNVSFKNGIVAGVADNGVTVAHKFGESVVTDSDGAAVNTELHDCGIVYDTPEKPYFICIMTRGYDLDDLAAAISKISNIVFTEIKK